MSALERTVSRDDVQQLTRKLNDSAKKRGGKASEARMVHRHQTLRPSQMRRESNATKKQEVAVIDEPIKLRPRSSSESAAFKNSWDHTVYFFSEEDFKRTRERAETVEVNTPQETSEPPRSAVKAAKKVRFAPGTNFDANREGFATDMRAFEQLPMQTRGKEEATDTQNLTVEKDDNGNPYIAGGKLEKLVSVLADQSFPSIDFIREFLYAFRSIMGPIKLLNMLIERFDWKPPENATQEELDYFQKYGPTLKLRVVNVIKKWLQNHYYDFLEEKRLYKALNTFINEKVVKELDQRWAIQLQLIVEEKHFFGYPLSYNAPLDLIEASMRRPDSGVQFRSYKYKKDFFNMCFWGEEFVKWISIKARCSPDQAVDIAKRMLAAKLMFPLDSDDNEFKDQIIYRLKNRPVIDYPKPLAPDNIQGPIRFLDVHPTEIARQMTLISQDRYLRINCKELTELVKQQCEVKAHATPNCHNMIEQYLQMRAWVATEVVLCDNLSLRVAVVKRFIQVAENLEKLQNFSDLKAVCDGLGDPSIARLQKTWKQLGKKATKQFSRLNLVVNGKTFRGRQTSAVPPVIPVLQSYIELLNKVWIQADTLSNEHINFVKLREQAKIFEEMEKPRNGEKYFLKPIPPYIQYLLEGITVLKESFLMQYSVQCEPKRPNEA